MGKKKSQKWKLVKQNETLSRETAMLQYMYSLDLPIRENRAKSWLIQALNDKSVRVAAVAEKILTLDLMYRCRPRNYDDWRWDFLEEYMQGYLDDELVWISCENEEEFSLDMLSEKECREIFDNDYELPF